MADTFNEYWKKQNTKRVDEQRKLFAYYFGDEDEVIKYLDVALNITYNSDDIEELQKNYINITKKAVNQLAVVYREQAQRQIIKNKQLQEGLTEYYNDRLWGVSTADNTALRYAKLCNTSLTRVGFDEGKIKYRVLPSWYYDVKVSDEDCEKMIELSYQCYFGSKLYRVYWTDTEHYCCEMLDIKEYNVAGNKQTVPGMKDMANPYGIIPYARLSLEYQNDFWGNGMCDFVNGNEQINLLLTELMNEHIIMGGAGTLLATNLNLASKTEDNEGGSGKKLRVGRKHPISVDNVKAEDAPPNLEYVNTDPRIIEIRDVIDWEIKLYAVTHGLNPNSFLAEVQDTSGFSKLMDALEQMDLRRDDLEPCRIYEDERFNITRKVNNYHASTTDKSKWNLQLIPDDVYLKVDFGEVKIYKTTEEQQKEDDWNLDKNLINIYDVKRRQNPDLTDDEIEGELQENKEINDRYKGEPVVDNELDENGNPKIGGGSNFYKQADGHSCGECVVRSILAMYGLELNETMDTDSGTSEEMLIEVLSRNGIEATVTRTDVKRIVPKSIAYYPEEEHWVSIEKVSKDKVLVNDSLNEKPEWILKTEFEQVAQDNYFITTKKKQSGD